MKNILFILVSIVMSSMLYGQDDYPGTNIEGATNYANADITLVEAVWYGEYNSDGDQILSYEEVDYSTSDSEGIYSFFEVPPGTYYIYVGDNCSMEINVVWINYEVEDYQQIDPINCN